MPFDVEMPDGTIIEGVPEGTPKELIYAKWQGQKTFGENKPGPNLLGQAVGNVKSNFQALLNPETYKQAGRELSNFPPIQPHAPTEDEVKGTLDTVLSVLPTTPFSKASRMAVTTPPKATTDMEMLLAEGVKPTLGQRLGPTAKRTEEALTSIPVVGDVIKGAQTKSIESFNKAAIDRSLTPIGDAVPKNVTGYRAIDYAHSKLSNAYDDLLPKVSGKLDSKLSTDISTTVSDYAKNLPAEQAKQLDSIVKENLLKKFDQAGNATGPEIKDAMSRLGKLARRFGKSENPDHMLMSEALNDIRTSVSGMLQKENPIYAGDLKNIDLGYANLLRVEKAAGSVGAKNGVFTPSQLANAVKSSDQSLRGSSYARGKALMQDLSSAGQNVLGQTLPDSGTAMRSLAPYLLAGGAGFAGQQGMISPETAAALAMTAAAFTPAGQATLRGVGRGIRSPMVGRLALGTAANR